MFKVMYHLSKPVQYCQRGAMKDDPELYRLNFETAQQALSNDATLNLIYVEIDALAPPRSRLINPRLILPGIIQA
jgi:hypothetical protein